jgi:Txe/YoeB family toxin of Txe-Axe toxin-antitoxin module
MKAEFIGTFYRNMAIQHRKANIVGDLENIIEKFHFKSDQNRFQVMRNSINNIKLKTNQLDMNRYLHRQGFSENSEFDRFLTSKLSNQIENFHRDFSFESVHFLAAMEGLKEKYKENFSRIVNIASAMNAAGLDETALNIP